MTLKMTFLEQSLTIKKYIEEFASTKGVLKTSNCMNENYIVIDEKKYVLSPSLWDDLYAFIIKNSCLEQELQITENQQNKKLQYLEQLMYNSLKKLEIQKTLLIEKKNVGNPEKTLLYTKIFFEIVENNLEVYSKALFICLQDNVLSAILKDELTEDCAFQRKEISLCNLFGEKILSIYFQTLNKLNYFRLFPQELKYHNVKITPTEVFYFEKIWVMLFENYLITNSNNFTKEVMNEARNLLETYFHVKVTNELLLQYVCKKILLQGFVNNNSKANSITYNGITLFFKEKNITEKTILSIEKSIEETLNEFHIYLGSIIKSCYVLDNIFEEFTQKVFEKKYTTVRYLKLNHNLVHEITLKSSCFKPFLTQTNKKVLHKENIEKFDVSTSIILKVKVNSLAKMIHTKGANKGFFNENSLLHDSKISDTQLSIDQRFLKNVLKLF